MSTLTDLVDGATNRLEELPIPFQHRPSRRRSTFPVFAALAIGAIGLALWARRRARSNNRTVGDADRAPTRTEERAADRAATDVRLDEVGKHAEEMNRLGANVRGEGQIEPTPSAN